MAGFMFPGLLADIGGMEGFDPTKIPQGLLSPALIGGQTASFAPTQAASPAPTPVDDPFGGDPRFNQQPAPVNGQPMPAIPSASNPVPSFQMQPADEKQVGFLEGSPAYQQFANAPAQGASPAGGAPFNGPQPEGPGVLEKLSTVLGGVYGQGGPGDGLINLGLALMSPGNKAENIMRAGQMAQANDYRKSQMLAMQQKQMREQLALKGNAELVMKAYPQMSPEQALAAAQQPAIVQEAFKRLNPSEQYTLETAPNGDVYQVNGVNQQRTLFKSAEKPQLVDVPQADGSIRKAWVMPGQTTGTVVGDGTPQPAVDPKTLATERAKQQVQQEGAAQDRERATSMVLPHLDRAEAAYNTLAKLNAIGPYNASGINRAIGGSFGTEAEKARQDYEAAAKELELLKAQIQMKGQGAITNSERAILSMTLPRLDAADPRTGIETLKILRKQFGAQKTAGDNASDPLGIR